MATPELDIIFPKEFFEAADIPQPAGTEGSDYTSWTENPYTGEFGWTPAGGWKAPPPPPPPPPKGGSSFNLKDITASPAVSTRFRTFKPAGFFSGRLDPVTGNAIAPAQMPLGTIFADRGNYGGTTPQTQRPVEFKS